MQAQIVRLICQANLLKSGHQEEGFAGSGGPAFDTNPGKRDYALDAHCECVVSICPQIELLFQQSFRLLWLKFPKASVLKRSARS